MLTQKIFVIGDALRAAKAASLLVHEMQYVDVTPLSYSFDELRALDIDDVLTGAPLSLSDKLVDAVPSRVLKTVREFVRSFAEGGGTLPDPATTTGNDGSLPKIPWVVTTRPWNEQG